MEENEKTTEYVKYHFSETEKKEIATEMAQKVTDLNGAEDEKKAIASDFKSRIDGLQANINAAATKLNNGYEMRNVDCTVIPDYERGVWLSVRDDNGQTARERKMSPDDKQRTFETA
jgi:hypothetical protein